MPFPWKKGKFSRIVGDHLNSAKRGRSLVVETGFPTSLVDLFVKNRDGLKRSSKKRKDRKAGVEQIARGPITGEPFPVLCPVYSSPARSISSPESFSNIFIPSPTISRASSFSSSPAIWRTPPRHSFSGSPIRAIEYSSAVVGDEGEVADVKGVLLAIIKVFFVVALTLGTNQFVVGLIISAFSLVSMEFIGKYLCRLPKPCQHAQITLLNFLEQVLRFTRIKNNETPRCSIEGQSKENQIEEEKPSSSLPDLSSMKETRISKPKKNNNNNHHLKPPRGKETSRMVSGSRSFHLQPESENFPIGGNLSHCRSLNWLSEEMDKREEAAPKNHHHHRSGSSKLKSKIIKLLKSKKKDEIEDPISDSDQKSSKSRGSKLKSKIKKIVVPNKLIKTSKKKHQQTNEQNIRLPDFLTIEEPIVCYSEEQEQPCTSPSKIMRDDDDDENREAAASVPKETTEERRDDFGGRRNRSRGCCAVLLPIILMGLVGGRFWAIALTLAWCSIWKLTAWMLWKSSFSSSSSSSSSS